MVIIGEEPILEALITADQRRELIVYGPLSIGYTLEYSLNGPYSWQTERPFVLTNLFQKLDIVSTNTSVFYRALRQSQ